MKQVLQSYRTGELWLADVEPPAAAPRGARVQTRASVLSAGTEKTVMELAKKSLVGKARARPDLVRRVLQKVRQQGVLTTLAQVREKLEVPVPMGYSAAGVVLDVADAPDLLPGMRVACAGAGYACHAEVNQVPRNLVVPLPDGVSFEEGAFATLGAIALQSVRQAEIHLGDRVVVIGLGLLGNLVAQLAAANGARVLGYDLSPDRAALGARLGCHAVCSDPEAIGEAVKAFTGGHGADTVIVAASAPDSDAPVLLAVELSRLRGRVVVVGNVRMNVPRNEAYLKELDVRLSMSYGPGRYDPEYEDRGNDYPYAYVRWTEQRNMAAFLEAVADGRVRLGPLITHRFPIEGALDAYALLDTREPYLGIVLTYGEAEPVATHAPPPPPAGPASEAVRPVRGRPGVGFLGAGAYARGVLLPALKAAGVDRVGVVNRTGASASQVQGFRWTGTDPKRLLDDPSVNAVFVGTRHHLHAEQVIAALRAGKHVFVEKPLCLTEEELAAVASARAEAGLYVQVGTNRRFSPYTRAVQEAFANRADPLQVIVRVNAGRLDASHWLRDPAIGGGRLVGEGVHWIDWCHAVVGKPIVRVHTTRSGGGPTSLGGDSFTVVLSFADGSVGTIVYAADGDRALPKEHLEVIGLGRAVVIEDWSTGTLYEGGAARGLGIGRGQHKGVEQEVEAFVATLRTGRAAVPPDVTWHVMHATLQAAASMGSGLPSPVVWPRPGV